MARDEEDGLDSSKITKTKEQVGKRIRKRVAMPASLWLSLLAFSVAGCGRYEARYVPYPQSPETGKVWQDIAPIIAQRCGGTACHSEGSRHGVYVGDRAAFIKDKKIIYRSLFVTKTMPKNGALTDRERAAIERYYQNN